MPGMGKPEDVDRSRARRVRDAIFHVFARAAEPLPTKEIAKRVSDLIGPTPPSSVRSYLRLNTPTRFARRERGRYSVRRQAAPRLYADEPTIAAPAAAEEDV